MANVDLWVTLNDVQGRDEREIISDTRHQMILGFFYGTCHCHQLDINQF